MENSKSSQPLTVGLVFDDSLDRSDGVQQQIRLLGRWLSSRGHTVHYIVGETTDFQPAQGQLHSLTKNVSVRANQNRLSLPLPVSRARIARLFDEIRFDVMHVMLPYSPFLGRSVVTTAQHRQIPVFGTFHTYPASFWQQLGSRLYGLVLRPQLNRFAHIMSVSAANAQYAQEAFGVESQVVPNCIDVKRFTQAKADATIKDGAQQLIIYMNRLDERKGAKYLVQAVAAMQPKARQKIRVLICGKGPLTRELETAIERFQLDDTVTLAGFIPEDDKPRYLASGDIAVYPATGGEAFGIVLIEAMAAGAVTLGGDNPGYRSVLGFRPETLFNPKDTDVLATVIEKLVEDTAYQEQIRQAQAEAVKQYDVETVGPQLESVYRQSIAKQSHF